MDKHFLAVLTVCIFRWRGGSNLWFEMIAGV